MSCRECHEEESSRIATRAVSAEVVEQRKDELEKRTKFVLSNSIANYNFIGFAAGSVSKISCGLNRTIVILSGSGALTFAHNIFIQIGLTGNEMQVLCTNYMQVKTSGFTDFIIRNGGVASKDIRTYLSADPDFNFSVT